MEEIRDVPQKECGGCWLLMGAGWFVVGSRRSAVVYCRRDEIYDGDKGVRKTERFRNGRKISWTEMGSCVLFYLKVRRVESPTKSLLWTKATYQMGRYYKLLKFNVADIFGVSERCQKCNKHKRHYNCYVSDRCLLNSNKQ